MNRLRIIKMATSASYAECRKLHDMIFGEHPVYSAEETWRNKSPECYMNEMGFAALVKDHTETSTWHIWLCGTLPQYRGKGVLTSLLMRFFHVHDDVNILTVCTYPKRFPAMYDWIKKRKSSESDLGDGKIKARLSKAAIVVREHK